MRANLLPKQIRRSGSSERIGTEAQMASDSVKATVTKLLQKNQPNSHQISNLKIWISPDI